MSERYWGRKGKLGKVSERYWGRKGKLGKVSERYWGRKGGGGLEWIVEVTFME